jgi:hypothetical protein
VSVATTSFSDALTRLGLLSGRLPRFITDVGGSGDVLEVVADARSVTNLPAPVRLATRLAPKTTARLRVEQFVDGVATVSVDASAGGLPAHKLLGLAAGRVDGMLAARRLPAGSVRVLPDARIALDVQRLLDAREPGARVQGFAFRDGGVVIDEAPAA